MIRCMDFIVSSGLLLWILGGLYVASVVHIAISKRVKEDAKIYWVIAALLIPFLPYFLWRMVALASPTDSVK